MPVVTTRTCPPLARWTLILFVGKPPLSDSPTITHANGGSWIQIQSVKQRFPKASSVRITWELARNAASWATPDLTNQKLWGRRHRNLCLNSYHISQSNTASVYWPLGCFLLHSRLRPVSKKKPASQHQAQIFTYPVISNMAQINRIFSHLEPACFAYPMKLCPPSASHR